MSRCITFTCAFVSVALALFGCPRSACAGDTQRHLFLDPDFIVRAKGVELHVNQLQQHEIVIRPDKPWEQLMITFYLTVLEENGRLRLWYVCRDANNKPNVAYAESEDGVHWQKPDLGIVEYEGNTHNNLVGLTSLEGTVYRDPKGSDDQRYVYVTHAFGEGMVRYFSPDGLHWLQDKATLLRLGADSQAVTFWDEKLQKYALYLRGWEKRDDKKMYRTVVRAELPDLVTPMTIEPSEQSRYLWGKDKAPVIGEELPKVLATDDKDPANSDVYTISAQPYPLDPEWYVGFPSFFRREATTSQGRLEVQFIGSRDGVKWNRYDRAPYVPLGLEGSETANMVYIGPGLIVRGDEIWQYGTGYRSKHGDKEARKLRTDGVICRYVQRVDGFVSADFGAEQGVLNTVPVRVTDSQLLLNVDTGAMGQMTVGLLDADGKPLAGYEARNCEELRINSTHAAIRWKDHADVAALRGRDVRVAFVGSRSKLFSFRFESPPKEGK